MKLVFNKKLDGQNRKGKNRKKSFENQTKPTNVAHSRILSNSFLKNGNTIKYDLLDLLSVKSVFNYRKTILEIGQNFKCFHERIFKPFPVFQINSVHSWRY